MERVLITPKEDWIHIVNQEVYRGVYGYKGEVAWYTDRNEKIQRISSIHLDLSSRFRRLFEIKRGGFVQNPPNKTNNKLYQINDAQKYIVFH